MKILKRLARVAGGLVILLLVGVGGVYAWSQARMSRTYEVTPAPVPVSDDPAVLARGAHVARIRGCVDCHGEGLAGRMFMDAMPMARLWAENLTAGRGGVAAGYRTDGDWVRAIRDGVAPDGKPLLFMPSHEYRALGPRDLGALVSWIKSLPPRDSPSPGQSVGPLGRVLFVTGQLPLVPAELIDHDDRVLATQPAEGPTVPYGAYLASSCIGCHGSGLTGGPIPGGDPSWPPAANLTPDPQTGLGSWSQADFRRFFTSGVRPDGRAVDPAVMPWPIGRAMTGTELDALWAYLRSLPPRPAGNR